MKKLTGILLVLASAISFGTLAILARYAYSAGLDTFTILFLRFGMAAIVMGIWVAWRREKLPRLSLLLQLAGMGAIGYVGQAFLYFTALKYTSPGLVALLLYLYPVFVAVLSVLFRHERFTAGKLLALALAFAGVALTVNPGAGSQSSSQWTGILLATGAALVYSFYIIVGAGVLQQVSAVFSTTVIFASAAAMSGMIVAFQAVRSASAPHWPGSPESWLIIGLIVLLATLIPVVTFLAGMERIGPTNASMLSTIEPVVTVLLAAWILSEPLPAVALLGGSLILVAVLLLSWSELHQTVVKTV